MKKEKIEKLKEKKRKERKKERRKEREKAKKEERKEMCIPSTELSVDVSTSVPVSPEGREASLPCIGKSNKKR